MPNIFLPSISTLENAGLVKPGNEASRVRIAVQTSLTIITETVSTKYSTMQSVIQFQYTFRLTTVLENACVSPCSRQ